MLQLILQFNILKHGVTLAPLATGAKAVTFCIVNMISRIFKPIVINNVLVLCYTALKFQRFALQVCHQSQKWHLRF